MGTRHLTDAERAECARLVGEGFTLHEAAAITGRCVPAVRDACTRFGVAVRKQGSAKHPHHGGARRYALDEHYFDVVDTADKAYWLGFLLADGGIVPSPQASSLRLELSACDRPHIERFLSALSSTSPIRDRPERNTVGVSLNSIHLIDTLVQYGIVPRKSTREVPWDAPDIYRADYWRGVVDGDGSIVRNHRGEWSVTLMGSAAVVTDFATFAATIVDFRAAPRRVTACPKMWQITINGRSTPGEVLRVLYGSSGLSLPRKQARVDELLAELAVLDARRCPICDAPLGDRARNPKATSCSFNCYRRNWRADRKAAGLPAV